eukprot:scaffold308389_cov19-Prasinocladus_malaysianus.AAC.1
MADVICSKLLMVSLLQLFLKNLHRVPPQPLPITIMMTSEYASNITTIGAAGLSASLRSYHARARQYRGHCTGHTSLERAD